MTFSEIINLSPRNCFSCYYHGFTSCLYAPGDKWIPLCDLYQMCFDCFELGF